MYAGDNVYKNVCKSPDNTDKSLITELMGKLNTTGNLKTRQNKDKSVMNFDFNSLANSIVNMFF